ncbi:MAG: hypothetical protein A2W31_06895 [Planctomycetes bacterium RBG_16_64_10]|nr:MAG: hypothetical protein A2W31_06895 [Planctomycetes bacterium RBG_16_64_10]
MSLAPQTLRRDVRTAFNTFLTKYFNGANHTVNGVAVSFRTCTINFQRPQIGPVLTYPLIVVEEVGDSSRGRFATKLGVRDVKRCAYRFLVFTTDIDKHWDINDNVQDLLETLLNGAAHELGLTGLHPVSVPHSVAWPGDPSQEFQISQRVVTFAVNVEYGAVS